MCCAVLCCVVLCCVVLCCVVLCCLLSRMLFMYMYVVEENMNVYIAGFFRGVEGGDPPLSFSQF